MRRTSQVDIVLVIAAAIGSSSCVLTPAATPVPVAGARRDLADMAGEWSGRYWSEAANRHGTIVFRLRAGTDTAYGQVEMTFTPSLRLYGESQTTGWDQRRMCTAIDIAIVRVDGQKIRGTLAPHWDPDCDCRVSTVFEGTLTTDRITGTFITRRESSDTPLLTGTWQTQRQRRKAAP